MSSPMRASRGLFRRFQQIGDQVGARVGVRHPRIGHAIGGHHLLRIGDEGIEGLRRPADAAAPDRGRVAEIRQLAGLALEHAMEARPFTLRSVEWQAMQSAKRCSPRAASPSARAAEVAAMSAAVDVSQTAGLDRTLMPAPAGRDF
jgi:hypothetical protein